MPNPTCCNAQYANSEPVKRSEASESYNTPPDLIRNCYKEFEWSKCGSVSEECCEKEGTDARCYATNAGGYCHSSDETKNHYRYISGVISNKDEPLRNWDDDIIRRAPPPRDRRYSNR